MAAASKTQIDRLGDRLRKGPVQITDLISLDGYRRSFGQAYETVVQLIRDQLKLEPTGRPAKSTNSIVEKLKRESIRLTQVQDIAGCRIVVPDVPKENRVVTSLLDAFSKTTVIDRRAKPSYGYRAVHVVVEISGKPVEIQVRTVFQHIWAEISEKYADVYGSEIKYGGGGEQIRRLLDRMSLLIGRYEGLETGLGTGPESDKLKERMMNLRKDLADLLDGEITWIDGIRGKG